MGWARLLIKLCGPACTLTLVPLPARPARSVRSTMPYIPAQSVGVDYLGFIWFVIMLCLSGASVLASQVAWYVHPGPTLYDRLFHRAAAEADDVAGRRAPSVRDLGPVTSDSILRFLPSYMRPRTGASTSASKQARGGG